jgi:hypothetical protein
MKNKNRIEGLWPDDEYLTPMGNGAAEVLGVIEID